MMACPQSVPTYGFDTCGKDIMLTRDGDGTIQEHSNCFAGRRVKTSHDQATLSLFISGDRAMQDTRRFLIEYRTFAVFTNHLGRVAWHIVKHSGSGMTFKSPSSGYWEGKMKVDVLGYTYTATSMEMPRAVVDDAGNEVVDNNGNIVVTDMTPGTTTGCTTL